jgi:hypothetical protein
MTQAIDAKIKIISKNKSKGWFGRDKHYVTYEVTDHRFKSGDKRVTLQVPPEVYHNTPEPGKNATVMYYRHSNDNWYPYQE